MEQGHEASGSVAELCRSRFPGQRFSMAARRHAGKVLAREGEQAAENYLQRAGAHDGRISVRAQVIARSRALQEMPVMLCTLSVQRAIFRLTRDEVKALGTPTRKQELDRIVAQLHIETHGVAHVQLLMGVFASAIKTYLGVERKVDNRNARRLRTWEHRVKSAARRGHEAPPKPVLESAYAEDGHLLHPPGLRHVLQLVQICAVDAYDPKRHPFVRLPEGCAYRDPNAELISPIPRDRTLIPEGQPGYVPLWQRPLLSGKQHRRMRHRGYEQGAGPLPVVARLPAADRDDGYDWVVFDARAHLRLARRRRLPARTFDELLRLFTRDPLINQQRGELTVTSMLLPEHSGFRIRKSVSGRKTRQELLRLATNESVALLACDLGVTHPVAAAVYRVSRRGDDLEHERLETLSLPDELLRELAAYRRAHDNHHEAIRDAALGMLSAEQQREVALVYGAVAEDARRQLCESLRIAEDQLQWDQMKSNSAQISSVLRERGAPESTYLVASEDTRRKKRLSMKTDARWAAELRPRLTQATRSAWNEHIWKLQRASVEYHKLSQRKRELARRIVNWTLDRAAKRSACKTLVVAVEDLHVRFFHGGGKRGLGWEAFFAPRREARWFVQALHKAYADLGPMRGLTVLEVNPVRTSIRCTRCGNIDGDNRDGERFRCIVCDHQAHADFDIATENIVQVATSGVAIRRAPDASGAASGLRPAVLAAGKSPTKLRRKPRGDEPLEMCEQAERDFDEAHSQVAV